MNNTATGLTRQRNPNNVRVYQQGLSTGLSKGRGYFLDTDLRFLWHGYSLAQALKKAEKYGKTLRQSVLF